MAITQDQVSEGFGPSYAHNLLGADGYEVVWTVSFDYTGPIDEEWHERAYPLARWGYYHQQQTALPGPWTADPFGEMPGYVLDAEGSRELVVDMGIVTNGLFWRDTPESGASVDTLFAASSQVTVGDATFDGVEDGAVGYEDTVSSIQVPLETPLAYDGAIPVYVGTVEGWSFSGGITIKARIFFGGEAEPVRVMVV